MTDLPHRPDIDGLRALAVVPVVLFHAHVAPFAAGSFGVDVFFVISGFLITRMVVGDLDTNTFSLAGFYRRRVVRILPALLVMIVLVCAIGAATLLPSEFKALSISAAAAALFVANLYAWLSAHYFSPDANTLPLLHTWSLGVEEQFYLVFPWVLMLIHRTGRKFLMPAALGMTAASILLWIVMAQHDSTAPFYFLIPRAWEFGFGAIVAIGPGFRIPKAPREAIALFAIALTLVPMMAARAGSAYYPATVLPCLGAALLVGLGDGTLAGRLLAVAPLRWIGQRSYSLYLWHWPLLTLWRIQYGSALSPLETVALISASVAAAALSYAWIEQPSRQRWRRAPRPARIALAGIAASIAVALLAVGLGRVWHRPLPAAVERVAAYGDPLRYAAITRSYGIGRCTLKALGEPGTGCPLAIAGRHNVLLFGDSHAQHIWRALVERYPNYTIVPVATSGCRPEPSYAGRPDCAAAYRAAMAMIASGRIEHVVIAARWQEWDLPGLTATLAAIRAKGVPVTVLGPVTSYDGAYPNRLARAMLQGDLGALDRVRTPLVPLDRKMAMVVRRASARYLSMYDAECPAGKCSLLAPDGAPIHSDSGHFTLSGARMIVAALPPFLPPR